MSRRWAASGVGLLASVGVAIFASVSVRFTKELPSDAKTVLLLHFNEGKGVPRDSSSHKHKVTVNGAEWTKQGKFGSAVSFKKGLLSVAYADSLSLRDAMTVEMWIKPTAQDLSKGYHIVAHKRRTQTHQLYLGLRDGKVISYPGVWARTKLKPDRWYHIAYIVTGTKDKGGREYIFVNGVLDAEQSSVWVGATDKCPISLGGLSLKVERFTGLVDELRISNVARPYPSVFREK